MKPTELAEIIDKRLRPCKWFFSVGITGDDEKDTLHIYLITKPKGSMAKPLEDVIAEYPENKIEVKVVGKVEIKLPRR